MLSSVLITQDGWTQQLAYTMVHRAQVSGGNRRRQARNISKGYTRRCMHLSLTETFDAYEHWCGQLDDTTLMSSVRCHITRGRALSVRCEAFV
jgi:hypothetical protein